MKKMILAVLVLGCGLGIAAAQAPIKKVDVSARSVTRLGPRKSFSIDATKKDTVYNIAAGADANRIRVRTSKGYMTLAEILRKAGRTATTGAIRIGYTPAINTHVHGTLGTTNLVECSGLLCTCTGDVDCNDMFLNHGCGDIAGCDERGCWCLKL